MKRNYEIIDGRCVIPHGVSHIVYKELEGAYSLREVVIPTSVDMICAYAFFLKIGIRMNFRSNKWA